MRACRARSTSSATVGSWSWLSGSLHNGMGVMFVDRQDGKDIADRCAQRLPAALPPVPSLTSITTPSGFQIQRPLRLIWSTRQRVAVSRLLTLRPTGL
jgi:hypothetical protein